MNIALVIFRADPSRGGAERYTADLAGALADRGHAVSVLATSFAGLSESVQQVRLDARGATRLGRYLRFLDALDVHLAEHTYDVVHAMLPVRRCDVYHPHAGIAAEAIETGHLKYTGTIQRTAARLANRVNPKRRHFAAVERRLLMGPNPPVVLCLSAYVKRSVRRHFSLPEERLATLFNAVDLARFDPQGRPEAGPEVRRRLGIEPDRIFALMIAQDFERKGLREAIAAVAELEDRRLTLVVVGKQGTDPYRRLAERCGVGTQVIFAGATTEPFAYYRAADFFVLPTRHDPCSLVVLEALAMGLPVISTTANGACEIMTDGAHGFILPDPADVSSLTAAMGQMLDPARREDMARACLALRLRLAYGRHVDELLRIYDRRMSDHG